MSELVWAQIRVGGVIRRGNVSDLVSAFAADLMEDEGSETFENFPEPFIEDGVLVVAEEGMHNGEFHHVEQACQTLELTYHRTSHEGGTFDAEEVWWDPTCDGDVVKQHILNTSGEATLLVADVDKHLQAYLSLTEVKDGETVEQQESVQVAAGRRLSNELTELIDEWDEVPALEIVED